MKRLFNPKKSEQARPVYGAVMEDINAGQTELSPGLRNLYSPQITTARSRIRDVADILAEQGLLTADQVAQLREERRQNGVPVEKLLTRYNIVHEQVLEAKAKLYGYEFRRITPDKVDKNAFAKLDLKYITANHLMPISICDNVLTVGSCDPANVFAIDDVKRQTGMAVDVVVCLEDDIDKVCEAFDESKFNYNVDEFVSDLEDIELVQDSDETIEDLEKSAGESPVIKFVNYLLTNALQPRRQRYSH
jgi:type IV pilus assembly protein PilB